MWPPAGPTARGVPNPESSVPTLPRHRFASSHHTHRVPAASRTLPIPATTANHRHCHQPTQVSSPTSPTTRNYWWSPHLGHFRPLGWHRQPLRARSWQNGPQVSTTHPHDVRRPLKPIASCFDVPRHCTNRPRVKFHAHNTSNSSECHVSRSIPLSPQLLPNSSPTPDFRTMPPCKKPATAHRWRPLPVTPTTQGRAPTVDDNDDEWVAR